MEYTFDDILAAMKNDPDWNVPEDKKDRDIAGAAMLLMRI